MDILRSQEGFEASGINTHKKEEGINLENFQGYIENNYDKILAYVRARLLGTNIQNIETEAEDIVHHTVEKVMKTFQNSNEVIFNMEAYFIVSLKSTIIDRLRKIMRRKEVPADEVDIALKKIIDWKVLSDFSQTQEELQDKMDKSLDADYMYRVMFAPLDSRDNKNLGIGIKKYQRALDILALSLEGKNSKDIAKKIFAKDSIYADINKKYDLEDEVELKRASSLVRRILERITPQFLQDATEEFSDSEQLRPDESVLRNL